MKNFGKQAVLICASWVSYEIQYQDCRIYAEIFTGIAGM